MGHYLIVIKIRGQCRARCKFILVPRMNQYMEVPIVIPNRNLRFSCFHFVKFYDMMLRMK